MKAAISVIFFLTLLIRSLGASSYLPSSDLLTRESQGSIKDFHSFLFFPFGGGDEKVRHFLYKELQQVGTLIRKPILTPEGADFEYTANPSLTFKLVQLVDQDNKPLPVLQATLSVNSMVEILDNKELDSLSISRWCTYVKKSDNMEKVVKQTFPFLLEKFITEYRKENGKEKKPSFYIVYSEPDQQTNEGKSSTKKKG